MNAVALRAPRQLAPTIIANTKEPMGPKTAEPNCTAMVVEEDIVADGRTKM